ncbi:MAG: hypothetical protein P4L22_02435 [Candidatus Babeliales bacterium]|nr:hypothetical protein [Candidatus Babeliales bacterium]
MKKVIIFSLIFTNFILANEHKGDEIEMFARQDCESSSSCEDWDMVSPESNQEILRPSEQPGYESKAEDDEFGDYMSASPQEEFQKFMDRLTDDDEEGVSNEDIQDKKFLRRLFDYLCCCSCLKRKTPH